MKDNQWRKGTCPTNKVEWNQDMQFWVPSLDVFDVIELVRLGGF